MQDLHYVNVTYRTAGVRYWFVLAIVGCLQLHAVLLYSAENISDSLLVDTLPDHNIIHTIPHKQNRYVIFDSIESKGQSNWITKTLYKALIRSQMENSPSSDPTLIITPEEDFAGYEGRYIGNVYIINKKNTQLPSRDTSLTVIEKTYGQVRCMHFGTQDWRIRQQLHFRSGHLLDPHILADDERLLRSLSYIQDARIYVEPTFSLDTVDIVVITTDAKSLGLELMMTDIGEYQIALLHHNLIGLGAEATAKLYYDQPYSSPWGYGMSYAYPNIWWSYTNFYWDMMKTSYRTMQQFRLEKPFQSSSTRFGAAAEFRNLLEYVPDTDTLNENMVPLLSDYYNSWAGWSQPLGRSQAVRAVFTARTYRYIFGDRPAVNKGSYYDYHNRKMVIGAVQLENIRYFNTALIHGYGAVEDIPHGQSLKLTAGYEQAEFFSRPYFAVELFHAHYHWRNGYYSLKLNAGAFFDAKNNPQQGNVAFESEYFTRLYPIGNFYFRQFVALTSNYGIKRFPEESILAKETLPGLSSHYLKPFQSKTVLRIEPYLFAPWRPMQFRFTFSAHADLAAVRQNNGEWSDPVLLAGLGLGVIIRNEYLVIQNLSIRMTYYPRSELYDEHFGGTASTANPARYKAFQIKEPEVIPLR